MGDQDHITPSHPERWREAFEEQATEEAMAEVIAFAATYAAMIERLTWRRDPLIARELALEQREDPGSAG